jgi:hypothetical protein
MQTKSKVETVSKNHLTLVSEERSRRPGLGRRFRSIVAASFLFVAVCLMLVDFQRLEMAPKHEIHNVHKVHDVRPATLAATK